jgi:hypothetical protein
LGESRYLDRKFTHIKMKFETFLILILVISVSTVSAIGPSCDQYACMRDITLIPKSSEGEFHVLVDIIATIELRDLKDVQVTLYKDNIRIRYTRIERPNIGSSYVVRRVEFKNVSLDYGESNLTLEACYTTNFVVYDYFIHDYHPITGCIKTSRVIKGKDLLLPTTATIERVITQTITETIVRNVTVTKIETETETVTLEKVKEVVPIWAYGSLISLIVVLVMLIALLFMKMKTRAPPDFSSRGDVFDGGEA